MAHPNLRCAFASAKDDGGVTGPGSLLAPPVRLEAIIRVHTSRNGKTQVATLDRRLVGTVCATSCSTLSARAPVASEVEGLVSPRPGEDGRCTRRTKESKERTDTVALVAGATVGMGGGALGAFLACTAGRVVVDRFLDQFDDQFGDTRTQ